jgi:hypothetical protein
MYLALCVGIVATIGPFDRTRDGIGPGRPLQEEVIDVQEALRTCGPLSLFLWLNLSGYHTTYKEVADMVPVSEKGTSLSELADASSHWFSGLRIISAQPGQLDSAPLPAIAHVWLDDNRKSQGHYIVVLKVATDKIVYADSSILGGVGEMPRVAFNRMWSGYLLTSDDPVDIWSRRAAIGCLLILAPLGGFAVFRLRQPRALQGVPSIALSAVIFVWGCNAKSPMDSGSSDTTNSGESIGSEQPLKTSARKRNLGVVRLGSEARAVFTLSNVSERVVELRLGIPTCGCLRADLSKERLKPRESVNLELFLKASQGVAGPAEGGVEIGTVEPETTLVFFAEGVVEGMKTEPYSMPLPKDLAQFTPDPIYGEIAVGIDHTNARVKITAIECPNAKSNSIAIGEPRISALEDLGSFARVRFEIPVELAKHRRPKTNVYRCQITYEIDDKTSQHNLNLNVFPTAE